MQQMLGQPAVHLSSSSQQLAMQMQPPHEFQNSSNANTHNVPPSLCGPPSYTHASIASQETSSSDWQEFTATDGRRYYYNKRTKQSSWEKPLELMTPLERADASTVWKEFTTAEGKKYYYNKDTKQSTWTIPDELKLARELAEKEASRGTQSLATFTPSTYDQPSASVSLANDVSSSTTTKMSKKDARCLATTSVGTKKVRGKTMNVKLRKLWEKNGKRALPVEFDKFDQNTYRPVGDNADDFTSLVGTLVRDIPKRYESWDKVPEEHKIAIWPTIETFFDMRTHSEARFANKVKLGVSALCAQIYRGQKWRFKGQWFTKRAGYEHPEQIRLEPPPNMDPIEWNKYVDYYLQEGVVKRSESNTANRAQQKFQSLHGRKAYAQYRHQNRDPETLQYPSLIDQYAHMHMKNGVFVDPLLEENHRQMEQLRSAQSGSLNPISEADILKIVLGERRGHNRGRGRKLRGSSDSGSGSQSQGVGRVYTQAEVDAMFAAQMATQNLQTQAIFDALRRSGISVNVPHPTNLGNYEGKESDEE